MDNKSESGRGLGRRALLGGTALLGGLAAAGALPGKAIAQARAKRSAGPDNSFTLSIGGEVMAARAFTMQSEPEAMGVARLMKDSDVAYAHLETNLAHDEELKWAMRGSTGPAGYLVADPQIAHDLAEWMGVDALSLAHNHSYDWGPEGMFATIRHCNAAGIAVAGTGKNLEEARAPVYFESDKGRMAMVSVASGNSAFEWAGHPKGKIPGRPGMNPLRVLTAYEVPAETAKMLKATAGSLGVMNAAAAAKKDFNITPMAVSGSNGYSGFTFREGDNFEIHTEGHPGDIAGNLRSIDEAAKMADYVMVAHHNSTSEGTRSVTPSDFVIDFARKAIDAGADIYIGHGWHTFLGIEIYKGKPILYGLGSLFWQSHFMPRKPADQFESYNFDMDKLTTLNAASGVLHPGGMNPDWGWSAIQRLKYVDKKLVEIELHPIEMGFDYTGEKPRVYREIGAGDHKYIAGDPRLATGANAQQILLRLQKINALRGTKMEIRGGVGVITVAA
jgi:poly-gamma-glutamate synthesis protein (capsule biosynthesis protein)